MHFWIDKRSSYGIGHNRAMASFTYQHRRIRSKSIVTSLRQQHPPCIPSTSHHHAKCHHLTHHRNRPMAELDHRANHSSRTSQHEHSNAESSAAQTLSVGLNSHHVPVIHSVYPRNEMLALVTNHVHHTVEPLDNSRSSGIGIGNHWLSIYLKGGICVTLAIILLTLKLYYDNDLTGLQLVSFGSMSIVLVIFTMTITILRMRKNSSLLHHRIQRETFIPPVIDEPIVFNQSSAQSDEDNSNDLPPPYAVAIRLPDKQSIIDCSLPPSYEKIHMT